MVSGILFVALLAFWKQQLPPADRLSDKTASGRNACWRRPPASPDDQPRHPNHHEETVQAQIPLPKKLDQVGVAGATSPDAMCDPRSQSEGAIVHYLDRWNSRHDGRWN